jgi:DNA-binding NtrC family response regulator
VRVIAATNRDLERAVTAGEFRQDLYYRLQVVTLKAPPLRARKQDIPSLVEAFLEQVCRENNLPAKTISDAALGRLAARDYPGNVRELRNVVERLLILTPGRRIDDDDVGRIEPALPGQADGPIALRGSLRETLLDAERRVIQQTLEQHGWHMTAAANALGLERSHLYKKLKALEIEKP